MVSLQLTLAACGENLEIETGTYFWDGAGERVILMDSSVFYIDFSAVQNAGGELSGEFECEYDIVGRYYITEGNKLEVQFYIVEEGREDYLYYRYEGTISSTEIRATTESFGEKVLVFTLTDEVTNKYEFDYAIIPNGKQAVGIQIVLEPVNADGIFIANLSFYIENDLETISGIYEKTDNKILFTSESKTVIFTIANGKISIDTTLLGIEGHGIVKLEKKLTGAYS